MKKLQSVLVMVFQYIRLYLCKRIGRWRPRRRQRALSVRHSTDRACVTDTTRYKIAHGISLPEKEGCGGKQRTYASQPAKGEGGTRARRVRESRGWVMRCKRSRAEKRFWVTHAGTKKIIAAFAVTARPCRSPHSVNAVPDAPQLLLLRPGGSASPPPRDGGWIAVAGGSSRWLELGAVPVRCFAACVAPADGRRQQQEESAGRRMCAAPPRDKPVTCLLGWPDVPPSLPPRLLRRPVPPR